MIENRLAKQLEQVSNRFRRFSVWRNLAACWVAAAGLGGAVFLLCRQTGWTSPLIIPAFMGIAALCGAIALWRGRRTAGNKLWVARRIEAQYPDLDSVLLTAIEQQRAFETEEFGYLQTRVINRALLHAQINDWPATLPIRRIVHAQLAHLAALLLLGSVTLGLYAQGPQSQLPVLRMLRVTPKIPVPADFQLTVEPGDTQIERATSLIVLARFEGPLPADVTLVATDAAGEVERIALTRSLDDPLFGGRLPAIQADMTYRVEFADQQSREFQVTVFEYPTLVRADAQLQFPEYTGEAPLGIEDVRQITAVERTKLRLAFELNKPVTGAVLVTEDGTETPLRASSGKPAVYEASFTLQHSIRYTLRLTDVEGRKNKNEPTFVINVLPNRRPTLRAAIPAKDLRVSPLEEMAVKAVAQDDFGLVSYGVNFSIGEADEKVVELGQSPNAKSKQEVAHTFSLEALSAAPDQLLSYYFWVDDHGPDGKVRRTFGDMYFAEVRHFEEIFRQAQQSGGGGGQKGGGGQTKKIDDLAKLQKQIVNATWKLRRQQTSQQPTDNFEKDTDVIRQSQQQALEKVHAAKEKLKDEQSKKFSEEVMRYMTDAVNHLGEAVGQKSIAELAAALKSEQAAYQALLKLRAREHRVSKGQPQKGGGGGGGGGGGNRSQQQLQQLELTKKENRYESRKTAGGQQQAANRETNQLLNRLRELARRQGDLNEKLRELQSELAAAKTEQQQEELRRRLKRLREEQREILRDTDELKDKMQESKDQSQLADSKRQVEQTRQNMLRSSEALKNGQVSKAVNSGTRAQRDLQQLRDEFRKKSAGQFTDAMQRMRQDARELADKQQKLGDKLQELDEAKHKSLRGSGERKQISEKLTEQRQRMSDVMDQMRRVTQDAETAEPLLAKHLYDTLRRTSQQKPDQALSETKKLLDKGMLADAGTAERQARKGIDELKAGIERAAESVLGDEAEALRRAGRELRDLTKRVQHEIAQAQGQQNPPATPGAEQPNQPEANQKNSGIQQTAGQKKSSQQGGNKQASAQKDANKQGQGKQGSGKGQGKQGQGQQGQGQGKQDQGQGKQSSSGKSSKGGGRGKSGLRGGQRQANPSSQQGGFQSGPGGPITGADFRNWSDRMRDVEEMLEDPKLREEVARVRDRVKTMRADFKRHSKVPNWSLVEKLVAQPLVELEQQVREELARKESKDALVPIDRDPVPAKYTDIVREYNKRLGRGK